MCRFFLIFTILTVLLSRQLYAQTANGTVRTEVDGKSYTLTFFGSAVTHSKHPGDLVFGASGEIVAPVDGVFQVVSSGVLTSVSEKGISIFFPSNPSIDFQGNGPSIVTGDETVKYSLSKFVRVCNELGKMTSDLPTQKKFVALLIDKVEKEVLLVQSGPVHVKMDLNGGGVKVIPPFCDS